MRKTIGLTLYVLAISCQALPVPVMNSPVSAASARLHAILKGHESEVLFLAFSPDGKTLASGCKDGPPRLWNVESGRLNATLDKYKVSWLAFLPDSKVLLAEHGDGLRLLDVGSGQLKATIEVDATPLKEYVLSPDGNTLTTVDVNDRAFLWDVSTGHRKASLQRPPKGEVQTLAYSPDGKTLAAGSDDRFDGKGAVWLWDLSSGQLKANLQGHTGAVIALAFSPDGRTVASGGADKTVRLWDVAGRQLKATLQGHKKQVELLAFSPDGKTLATGSLDETARLWNVADGRLRATLRHMNRVTGIAFASNGKTLATGSYDKTARLWDVISGRLKAALEHEKGSAQTIAFSPDGKMLATGGGYTQFLEHYGEARLWDVSDVK